MAHAPNLAHHLVPSGCEIGANAVQAGKAALTSAARKRGRPQTTTTTEKGARSSGVAFVVAV
jgi:hypothetical protein